MSEPIAIERGVPLPARQMHLRPRASKYPFAQLEVGDSFAIPLSGERKNNLYVTSMRLTSAAASHRKRNPGWAFSIRTLPDEGVVRIWRVS